VGNHHRKSTGSNNIIIYINKSMEKDSLAYATIELNMEDEQLVLIRSTNNAKSAWNALKMYHEKSNANSLVRLIKRLMNMKLEERSDLEMHIACIAEAFQQLHDISKELKTDDWHVAVLPAVCQKVSVS